MLEVFYFFLKTFSPATAGTGKWGVNRWKTKKIHNFISACGLIKNAKKSRKP